MEYEHPRFGLAQMSPGFLDVQSNTARICALLEEASREETACVLFPELCLTGYSLSREALPERERPALAREVAQGLRQIALVTERTGVGALVSYPVVEEDRLYIAAACFYGGKLLGEHRKLNLCNYGHYREHKTFTPGDSITVIQTPFGKCGILICEDLWHPENAILAVQRGAEYILAPSAPCVLSPEDAPKALTPWHHIGRGISVAQVCWVLCCCRTGREGEALFLGGSHVLSPQGEMRGKLPLLEEGYLSLEISRSALERLREQRPLGANLRRDLCARSFGELLELSERV